MLEIEQHELAARRLHDMADAGRRELDDEMPEFRRLGPRHGFEAAVTHNPILHCRSIAVMPMFYWPLLRGGTLANEVVFGGVLVQDQRCARFVEDREMPGLQMGVEGSAIAVDLVEQ